MVAFPPRADFNPAVLFQRANRAAYSCLKSWEGSVQVSLAALELMAGLSRLQIENISKITSLWSSYIDQLPLSFLPSFFFPPSLAMFLPLFRAPSLPPSPRPCRLQAGS